MKALVLPLETAGGVRLAVDHDGTAEALAIAAANLLYAIDRGDFGDLRIGPSDDRAESAYIAGLREKVAAFEALRRAARAA